MRDETPRGKYEAKQGSPPSQTVPLTSELRADDTSSRNRAWRRLYETHFDDMYRLIGRCGVPGSDIEDLTQRVFEIAHRRLGEEDIENVGGWLRGIAVRVVSDHFRWHRVRRAKRWVLEMTVMDSTPAPASPSMTAEMREAQEAIGRVLSRMSRKLRDVLVLTDIEDSSVEEAASILGIPPNTVRSRRQRAREEFRRMWVQTASKEDPHGSG